MFLHQPSYAHTVFSRFGEQKPLAEKKMPGLMLRFDLAERVSGGQEQDGVHI